MPKLKKNELKNHDVKVRLDQIPDYFARHPTRCTIWNWRKRGLISRSGKRVKLRCWHDGSMLFTTEDEIIRFKQELNK